MVNFCIIRAVASDPISGCFQNSSAINVSVGFGVKYSPALKGHSMPPTLGNGKICYLEIPASDVQKSARFYESVFGWNIRHRRDGSTAFDDGVGEVSGAWVTGRSPSIEIGVLTYIMVESVSATIEAIIAQGGKIVQPIGVDEPEITARFSDPHGNIFGLYQEPK
jgi:predicted enzyme related to lactoylglutathione lyase